FSRNSSRRVLRFLIVYSASAKVSWLMIESVYVGNGVNYARLEQFFRGSISSLASARLALPMYNSAYSFGSAGRT
ncbi:hypothetical protein, partial [Microbulbifer discodermiae]|uniref:hypothetical protein n=1 Tax=Microbulbifer sp. 2201CG32-9 TaxID=3232309 RepID=UPI00345C4441